MAEVPDRYCRNCGQELQTEDRFCGSCGRPVPQAATVSTPEADVPVPPPPLQVAAVPQQPQAVEQVATPSAQPQQHSPWGWRYAKGPVYLFLGIVIATSLLDAAVTQGGGFSKVGFAIGEFLGLLLAYVPTWLILGGLVYLVARLLGKKPAFLQVLFNWWVTIAVVVLVIVFESLGGFLVGVFEGLFGL